MAHQQTIKFRIRQDGIVEEIVEGCTGPSCELLTENIEKALGQLQYREPTADRYSSQEQVVLNQENNVPL
tara:strand:- start:654 stop:863 length:210 start_codon:yes stop_codon:yes gene_type:complete